jgi:TonB family protein
VHISTEGAIDDCRIVQSSGSERLDTAACDHVKTNWRWQPPTASGRPVAVSTRVSVKWDLKDIVPPSVIKTTASWPPFPVAQWKRNRHG